MFHNVLVPIGRKQPTVIITLTFYNEQSTQYDIVQLRFVKKFFVHKVRNHNYGKSFEFQFYEIIMMSVKRGQRFNSEFLIYLSFQISWTIRYALSYLISQYSYDDGLVGKIVKRNTLVSHTQ